METLYNLAKDLYAMPRQLASDTGGGGGGGGMHKYQFSLDLPPLVKQQQQSGANPGHSNS